MVEPHSSNFRVITTNFLGVITVGYRIFAYAEEPFVCYIEALQFMSQSVKNVQELVFVDTSHHPRVPEKFEKSAQPKNVL